jgi:NADH-quinone oxidoreductase subunit A
VSLTGTESKQSLEMWPLFLYLMLVAALVGGMVIISYFLGERHRQRSTEQPYESGVPVSGSAGHRMPVRFYLVAMFFVIFDVESIFVFAWAVSFRDLGWPGYIEIVLFVGVLLAALVYLWKEGALNWGTPRWKEDR